MVFASCASHYSGFGFVCKTNWLLTYILGVGLSGRQIGW